MNARDRHSSLTGRESESKGTDALVKPRQKRIDKILPAHFCARIDESTTQCLMQRIFTSMVYRFQIGVAASLLTTSLLAEDIYKPSSASEGVVQKSESSITARNLREELNTPFQLALVSPIQLFSPERSVSGLRLNILFGQNTNTKGVDIGLINGSSGDFSGVELGAINLVQGNSKGIQYGLVSYTQNHFSGIQSNLLASFADGNFVGIQGAGLHANTKGDFKGLQGAWVTAFTEGDFAGLQNALAFNIVKGKCTGVQLGLVNIAGELNGVQIGLININTNGPLPVFPIVNIGF